MTRDGTRVRLIGPGGGTRGGIAQFNTELARVLGAEHADVAVIGFRRIYPRISRAGRQGADSSKRQERVDSRQLLVPWLPWTWVSAGRKADLQSRDLLVVQWWHPITAGCSWYLARQARARGARVVFVCHNAVPHEPFPLARRLSGLALRQASLLVSLSQPVAAELRRLVAGAEVAVIPHPPYTVLESDPSVVESRSVYWRSRLGIRNDTTGVVLFFGTVRPYKGLSDLLDAFAFVHARTGAILVVVGTFFESFDGYSRKVHALGIDHCVRLVDEYVPNEDVAPLFAVADVIALPYRSASQSGVLQVAAAVKKPVVATAVGGLPEALGGTGILVPPSDPEALGAALARALEQPPLPPPMASGVWQEWADVVGHGSATTSSSRT